MKQDISAVAAMREQKLDVEYIEVPAMGHCGSLPLKVVQRNAAFVAAALGCRMMRGYVFKPGEIRFLKTGSFQKQMPAQAN